MPRMCFFEPLFQKLHDVQGETRFAVLEPLHNVHNLAGEFFVHLAVRFQIRVPRPFHGPLFRLEMFFSVVHEIREQAPQEVPALTRLHGFVQPIDHPKELLVLLIDVEIPHGIFGTPFHQGFDASCI